MGNNGVLTIPNSVRIIEECAFAGNHLSGSLTLPESLETIGSMAFYVGGFSGSLTMPNSVTEIGHHAFFGCRFSGSLTLSSSLSKITNCAFADCHFSGTLVIPNSVNLIVSAAFYGNNFSELVLGESVTTIKSNAFADCNNLTGALKLPASLTQIDQMAFKNTSFNEIYSPNRIPPTLASNALQGYDANIPIYIPFGCTEVYQNAEGWNYFTNFIEEEPILYTDFDPDPYLHIVNSHEELCFDLDGDSISDVCFAYDLGSAWVYFHVTSTQDNLTLCYGLEEGDIIAHAEEWSSSWTFYSSPDDASHMGFRIEKYRNYYYGWLSTSGAPAPEQKWYFDKFAYCTIPNYPLEWGQTTITEGMEENPIENQFLVYPNPANSVLFVETFQETSLPNQTYRIINMMGQTLLHGNITAKTQQIIIENLPAGLYFISVGNVTQKFVVK